MREHSYHRTYSHNIFIITDIENQILLLGAKPKYQICAKAERPFLFRIIFFNLGSTIGYIVFLQTIFPHLLHLLIIFFILIYNYLYDDKICR